MGFLLLDGWERSFYELPCLRRRHRPSEEEKHMVFQEVEYHILPTEAIFLIHLKYLPLTAL